MLTPAEQALRAAIQDQHRAGFDRLAAELVQAEQCACDVLPGAHEVDVREQIATTFLAFREDLLRRFSEPFPRLLPPTLAEAPTPVALNRGHIPVHLPPTAAPVAGVTSDTLTFDPSTRRRRNR